MSDDSNSNDSLSGWAIFFGFVLVGLLAVLT